MTSPAAPLTLMAASFALFGYSWAFAPDEALHSPQKVGASLLLPRRAPSSVLAHPRLQASGKAPFLVHGFDHPGEIALTFDDGPHPIHTARLLDILARHEAQATFFVNGMWLDRARGSVGRSRSVLMRAELEGHTIGNHTYSHALLSRLPPEKQRWEIVANEVLVSQITGSRMRLFRPPYGQLTAFSSSVLREYGYQIAMWNITAPEDEMGEDPTLIAKDLLRWMRHHEGGILLLHDRHPWSVDAAEIFLGKLHAINCRRLRRGDNLYRVVPLDSFLRSPAESRDLAAQTAKDRAQHRQRLERLCQR
ncbi:MAG: polysaccharide deacetylase family protein [Deltaproteobacteria bacterium]|nr:polysaccharide deacetylase family protein [Deltaproteobacteria bacterium]